MQHCTLLAGLTAMKSQTILGEDSMVKLTGKQCICIVLSVSCQYCIVVYKYLYQVFVLISKCLSNQGRFVGAHILSISV